MYIEQNLFDCPTELVLNEQRNLFCNTVLMLKKKESVFEQPTLETVKVLMGREVTAFVTTTKNAGHT